MNFDIKYILFAVVLSGGLAMTSCKNETTTTSAETPSAPTAAPEGLDIGKVQFLEAEDFKKESSRGGAVLIDVRLPQEFEKGHIEGAKNINFFDPKFKENLLDLNRDKSYYLYAKNEAHSKMAAAFMMHNDFPKVFVLRGGYDGWLEKGL